eukprot:SAG31_NODE_17501_length_668_cov_1.265378_1_plen_132_part_01
MPASIIKSDGLLARVQMTFARFSTAGLMNQEEFTEFCLEMGHTNCVIVPRLFHAFDRDNTGALELVEFADGLRRMCEYRHEQDARDDQTRAAFAFRMLDTDGGNLVDLMEVQEFLEGFLDSAAQEALGCMQY